MRIISDIPTGKKTFKEQMIKQLHDKGFYRIRNKENINQFTNGKAMALTALGGPVKLMEQNTKDFLSRGEYCEMSGHWMINSEDKKTATCKLCGLEGEWTLMELKEE